MLESIKDPTQRALLILFGFVDALARDERFMSGLDDEAALAMVYAMSESEKALGGEETIKQLMARLDLEDKD